MLLLRIFQVITYKAGNNPLFGRRRIPRNLPEPVAKWVVTTAASARIAANSFTAS
jgi:hypothetical protein